MAADAPGSENGATTSVSVASPTPEELNPFSHPAVVEFGNGVAGVSPGESVVAMAGRIVQAAAARTVQPEITVDVDGALSFDLRLADGLLLLAELSPDGSLDAGVYDDKAGERVKRLPRATEEQLVSLF